MNIFEKLNALLVESKGEHEVKTSDIPVHPDMETKEQGEMAAAEKIFKLFQKVGRITPRLNSKHTFNSVCSDYFSCFKIFFQNMPPKCF